MLETFLIFDILRNFIAIKRRQIFTKLFWFRRHRFDSSFGRQCYFREHFMRSQKILQRSLILTVCRGWNFGSKCKKLAPKDCFHCKFCFKKMLLIKSKMQTIKCKQSVSGQFPAKRLSDLHRIIEFSIKIKFFQMP